MDSLGPELPPRRSVAHALVLGAAVLAVPTVRTAALAWGESGATALGAWAMAAVMLVVLVAVPLLLARSILTRHTYLSEDAVTIASGSEVRQQIAFADLTEVRVRPSGRGGEAMRNDKVFLVGRMSEGRGDAVLVSRIHVESLQPLLQRLAAEVGRRPELLATDVDRDYFAHALRTAP